MHQIVRDRCIDSPVLRTGRASDIDALVDLEAEVFATDRLSRRSFRALLRSRSAALIVADCGSLCGYALVLLRRGSSVARLYSLAVNPGAAGRGIGKALLAAAEETALARKRLLLRLEVNEHNAVALALYKNAGYRELTYRAHFYEDGTGAQRREKMLANTYTSLRADVAPTLGE